MSKEELNVMTPEFRVSFPHVFKPNAFQNQEPKYSVQMLFDKDIDLKAMKRAAKAAAVDKWGADKAKWPRNLRLPFRDGNEKPDLDGYENVIFVSASSKQRPGVVDQRLQAVTEEDGTFYAGCYARATLRAFAYDAAGNRGISFGLQNLQKTRDGDPFSGRKKAEDEFDAVETVDDDDFEAGDDIGVDDEDFL